MIELSTAVVAATLLSGALQGGVARRNPNWGSNPMTGDTLPQLLPATQKSDDGEFLHVMAKTTLNRLMDFPAAHRLKRRSTNGLERLDKEVNTAPTSLAFGAALGPMAFAPYAPTRPRSLRLVAAW